MSYDSNGMIILDDKQKEASECYACQKEKESEYVVFRYDHTCPTFRNLTFQSLKV